MSSENRAAGNGAPPSNKNDNQGEAPPFVQNPNDLLNFRSIDPFSPPTDPRYGHVADPQSVPMLPSSVLAGPLAPTPTFPARHPGASHVAYHTNPITYEAQHVRPNALAGSSVSTFALPAQHPGVSHISHQTNPITYEAQHVRPNALAGPSASTLTLPGQLPGASHVAHQTNAIRYQAQHVRPYAPTHVSRSDEYWAHVAFQSRAAARLSLHGTAPAGVGPSDDGAVDPFENDPIITAAIGFGRSRGLGTTESNDPSTAYGGIGGYSRPAVSRPLPWIERRPRPEIPGRELAGTNLGDVPNDARTEHQATPRQTPVKTRTSATKSRDANPAATVGNSRPVKTSRDWSELYLPTMKVWARNLPPTRNDRHIILEHKECLGGGALIELQDNRNVSNRQIMETLKRYRTDAYWSKDLETTLAGKLRARRKSHKDDRAYSRTVDFSQSACPHLPLPPAQANNDSGQRVDNKRGNGNQVDNGVRRKRQDRGQQPVGQQAAPRPTGGAMAAYAQAMRAGQQPVAQQQGSKAAS